MSKAFYGRALVVVLLCASCSLAKGESYERFSQAPVADDDLAKMAGGSSSVTNAVTSTQSLNATNAGNTINAGAVTTGQIFVPTGAFNGFNGVGNFVFNTGNNNNLQGSLSITIFAPPGT